MLSDAQKAALLPVARTLQIIVAALAIGVVTFFIVVLLIVKGEGQNAGGGAASPLITYIALGAAVAAAFLALTIPNMISARQRMEIASGKAGLRSQMSQMLPLKPEFRELAPLVAIYHARVIIFGALLEGAAFFNLIAYMIEHQMLSLVVAGCLLLMMLSQFPTPSRFENWIESEQRTIDELRLLGPSNG
jgi:hypothetical protein